MVMIPTGKWNVVKLWNIQEGKIIATFNSKKEANLYIMKNKFPQYDGFSGYEVQEDLDYIQKTILKNK